MTAFHMSLNGGAEGVLGKNLLNQWRVVVGWKVRLGKLILTFPLRLEMETKIESGEG